MSDQRPSLPGRWTLWPQVLVRGAGFDFAQLDAVFRAEDSSARLREVAGEPRFREAVTWQNRAAVADGLDSLLRKAQGATDSKTRKKELMVARYLQRYCAKNDTIGFFGPVGWARWGAEGRFVAGGSAPVARETFFEPWAVQALADAVARREELRGWVAPTLAGDVKRVGRTLVGPTASWPLTSAELRLLKRCDGERPAREVAPTEADRALLEQFLADGIVRWTFPVALSLDPAAPWRASVKKLRSPKVKRAVGAVLARLEAARAQVAEAAGTPRLGPALEALEQAFESEAEVAAKRHEGRTYGGRGLVFEECRRDGELTLSEPMRAVLAEPLHVLLGAARWYTFSIARRLAKGLWRVFDKAGGGRIGLHQFWRLSAPLFEKDGPPLVTATAKELSRRWEKLFEGTTDGLQPSRAAKLFAAPCPGWPGARHHAPDLMWSAVDAEQMLRGEGQPILAELHPGVTPFTTWSVLSLCPDRKGLEAEYRRDFPAAQVSPIPWEDFARSSQDARLAKDHWHLDLGGPFVSDRKTVLRVSDLTVEARGERLIARHPGGQVFDLLQIFERRIKLRAAVAFSLTQPGAHVHRRTLGPLVVQREGWRFETATLPLEGEDRVDRMRRFRAEQRLPERVFVRSPEEVKPIYVDFESPLSIEMLIRLARQAPTISVSEMLPGPQGLWLGDTHGRRYVSELRLLAVDPEPWRPELIWAR
jgi:hypothetical protein